MYRVQGTLREWVTRDEVRRFIAKKFKEFILSFQNPKTNDHEYLRQINEMVSGDESLICYICKFLFFLLQVLVFSDFYTQTNYSSLQSTSVVWRLIINSLSIPTQISLSGWQMHLSLFLRLWRRLLIKLCLIYIQTTKESTKKSMSELPTYLFMTKFAT